MRKRANKFIAFTLWLAFEHFLQGPYALTLSVAAPKKVVASRCRAFEVFSHDLQPYLFFDVRDCSSLLFLFRSILRSSV